MERAAGVEPASSGWKPAALPLSYARIRKSVVSDQPSEARGPDAWLLTTDPWSWRRVIRHSIVRPHSRTFITDTFSYCIYELF